MATFSKHILSGSSNGSPVVLNTATTTIHTPGSSTGTIDEVWLWCNNSATTVRELRLHIGTGGSTGNIVYQSVPPKTALYLVSPGLPVNASKPVYGNTTAADGLSIVGYVNRIAT